MTEAEIAEGLDLDQRKAIMTGKTRWLTYEQALEWPMCGTVERCLNVVNGRQRPSATPLGLAVREYLLSEQTP